MGDLGELLELLSTASDRFVTLRGVIRGSTAAASRAPADPRRPAVDVAVLEVQDDGPPSPRREHRARLWIDQPGRAREERDGGGEYDVGVRDGSRWWIWRAASGVRSSEDMAGVGYAIAEEHAILLDPSALLGALSFGPVRRTSSAGRPALAARASVREGRHGLPGLSDRYRHYELVADAERGVLLRLAALDGERPCWVREFEAVEFDVALPAETFRFALPEGDLSTPLTARPDALAATLDEAVRVVDFTLFVPPLAADAWHLLRVHVALAEPATVGLLLASPGLRAPVALTETASPGAAPPAAPGVAHLRIERDGTTIDLRSELLAPAELVRLADALRPAEGQPPRE